MYSAAMVLLLGKPDYQSSAFAKRRRAPALPTSRSIACCVFVLSCRSPLVSRCPLTPSPDAGPRSESALDLAAPLSPPAHHAVSPSLSSSVRRTHPRCGSCHHRIRGGGPHCSGRTTHTGHAAHLRQRIHGSARKHTKRREKLCAIASKVRN